MLNPAGIKDAQPNGLRQDDVLRLPPIKMLALALRERAARESHPTHDRQALAQALPVNDVPADVVEGHRIRAEKQRLVRPVDPPAWTPLVDPNQPLKDVQS